MCGPGAQNNPTTCAPDTKQYFALFVTRMIVEPIKTMRGPQPITISFVQIGAQ